MANSSFLDEVLKVKSLEIEDLKRFLPDFKEMAKEKPVNAYSHLFSAVESKGFFIIAEIKRASPSAGILNPKIEATERAVEFVKSGADAISVLTDSHWFSGNLNELKKVSSIVEVPVLMKDFIIDEVQIEFAAKSGASMVLLISKVLKENIKRFVETSFYLGIEPLVEVSNENEFKSALNTGCRIIGVNSRDLDDLQVRKQIFEELAPLARRARQDGYLVIAESGLSRREEVVSVIKLGYSGVLIGSRLSKKGGLSFLRKISTISTSEVF
ncbi:MAG: indole-3-glycerol-phosphate synthase [Actinobacteria bacterium]|nr:indole-3-glycerol-phosphate synthase [Actinomycetota bacterium]